MKRFTNPDEFIAHFPEWKNELKKLRSLLLGTELEEKIKWGFPVYTLKNKNVIGLGAFKSYAGLWFYQGVFLKDENKVLINAQEGKTKAMRQWRFSSAKEMDEKLILKYISEAIQNQKEGKEIKPTKNKALIIPDEMATYFSKNKNVKIAFEKFTPSKKREFAEYIKEAKRAATKTKRLEKISTMILEGTGLNDRHK